MSGKPLFREKIGSDFTSIPLDFLTEAAYLLKITRNDEEMETFIIVKSQ
jgi:hypothetical protein